MIANTIAISTCHENKFALHYFWRDRDSNAPHPFFDSGTKEYRYWPMDGFVSGGNLYVALLQVAKKPIGDAFGFEMIGVKMARIKNPTADPQRWHIDYTELASGKVAFPGVSAIVAQRWVYLFAVLADDKHPKRPMILTRIPLTRLAKPAQAIEYLAKDGAWKRDLDWADARIVIDAGHTEMSIRYHSAIQKWIAVQQKPGLGAGVGVRTASHLEGPWSSFDRGFSIEEKAPGANEKTFCYAAKEHIEFARTSGEMLITYICNSTDLRNLISDMSLYRPQAVWTPIKR